MINKNIIISTQPVEQAEKLSSLIQSQDVEFIKMPLIKTKTFELNKEIKNTLINLSIFNYIIFTSKRGVSGFFKLLKDMKLSVNHTSSLKFAVIGKPTAIELKNYGFKADYINPGNTSKEFLFYLLRDVINNCDKILMPLGNLASNFLPDALSEVATVTKIDVYETIKLKNINKRTLNKIDQNDYHLLVFTSPSAFENFIEITDYVPSNKKLSILSIGQTTTNAIQKLGFKVLLTAKKSTIEELAKEIEKLNNKYNTVQL
ncbi:MAG: hypothetical protein DRI95_10330 [Bacteroidetes bacterium]|nr:MAG: hypothetical protein DRI95_10330 [Bacteroidota bacterium]RLD77959.1 MAG: hypothetical protein DRJ07_13930 [Bacteroidota bacterium]